MEWGFDSKANDNQSAAISLNALRGQALKRLAGVHHKLDSKGVSATFTRAARPDPMGDMGFLGGLIMDMIVMGPFASFLGAHFPLHLGHLGASDIFNHVAATAALEGASIVADQDAYGYRSRRLSDYPEGRRKCALEEARINRKFNLVSGSQNNRFSFDVQADLACMYEILDMLDRLEEEGVKMLRLDRKKPVYDVLKKTTKKMFGKGAIRSFATPVMRVV